ncbi:unnamed protein product [Nippostrongylus brasiliensis]|uniref:Serine/threonine-protein phosphatase 4 regulatory subunit n=1 Tax=Nippostrongylus brasiliensis TaxID=27835 RepID=A0A0N4YFF9_NIPBR|nr:unnamed protein product [Nippostrongylus brasiliensis]
MLTEIRERLIRRLYKQILDCIQQEHGSSPLDVEWLLSQPASVLPEPILRLLTDLKTCKKVIADINHALIREAHMRVLMEQQTAELRALVNNGQFEEALRTFDSLQGSDLDGLRKLALDTIFDAVTKYRDNNDDNLRTLIVSLFDPDEWLELKEVLPAKLAEHLSVESDDDVLYPAAHAAHIMFIFKEIPFLIPEGTIVELLEDLDTADLDPCCNLLLPLLRFVEDFEQRSFRVPIMDKCQQLIQLFPSAQRCLFFKLILPKIFDNNDLCLDNESTVVAWLVDLYRRNLDEEPFQKELGSFMGILKDVRYSEMLQASNYYSSVFCLVQTIAAKRLNLTMLPIVESQLIDPIYAQLKDYIQLEEMRQKDEKQKKDSTPRIPENIGFEVAMPAPEGTIVEQLQLVMFGCEQSRKFIADALSSVQ